ncbi:MAG: hypothetical protein MHPSP_000566 [Paramarteilia canceri]
MIVINNNTEQISILLDLIGAISKICSSVIDGNIDYVIQLAQSGQKKYDKNKVRISALNVIKNYVNVGKNHSKISSLKILTHSCFDTIEKETNIEILSLTCGVLKGLSVNKTVKYSKSKLAFSNIGENDDLNTNCISKFLKRCFTVFEKMIKSSTDFEDFNIFRVVMFADEQNLTNPEDYIHFLVNFSLRSPSKIRKICAHRLELANTKDGSLIIRCIHKIVTSLFEFCTKDFANSENSFCIETTKNGSPNLMILYKMISKHKRKRQLFLRNLVKFVAQPINNHINCQYFWFCCDNILNFNISAEDRIFVNECFKILMESLQVEIEISGFKDVFSTSLDKKSRNLYNNNNGSKDLSIFLANMTILSMIRSICGILNSKNSKKNLNNLVNLTKHQIFQLKEIESLLLSGSEKALEKSALLIKSLQCELL